MLFKSTDKYTLLSSYLYCFIEFVYWDWEGLASIHFLMQLAVTLSAGPRGWGHNQVHHGVTSGGLLLTPEQ